MANKKIFFLETRLMFMSDLNYSFFLFAVSFRDVLYKDYLMIISFF